MDWDSWGGDGSVAVVGLRCRWEDKCSASRHERLPAACVFAPVCSFVCVPFVCSVWLSFISCSTGYALIEIWHICSNQNQSLWYLSLTFSVFYWSVQLIPSLLLFHSLCVAHISTPLYLFIVSIYLYLLSVDINFTFNYVFKFYWVYWTYLRDIRWEL